MLKKSLRNMLLPSLVEMITASVPSAAEAPLESARRMKSPFLWCGRFSYIITAAEVFKLPSRGKKATQVVVMYKLPGTPIAAFRKFPVLLSLSIVTFERSQKQA
jgi:hypothetical protein